MGKEATVRGETQPIDPPHDCEEDGHDYRRIGEANDGTAFYRCRFCKDEIEG